MSPLGPVLLATDFSAQARHAAHRAASVACETGSPLTLMHVLPGDALELFHEWLGDGAAAQKQLHQQADERLHRLAEQLQAACHLHVRIRTAAGSVLNEVLSEVQALRAGLIVVGTGGRGLLRRPVAGLMCQRLLGHTSTPLLVVRQRPNQPYRRVLVPVDWSAGSGAALALALALAHAVAPQARVLLMTAQHAPLQDRQPAQPGQRAEQQGQAQALAERQLHGLAVQCGLMPGQWEPIVVQGEASSCILEQERAQDVDLVVLARHARSSTQELLPGNVTRRVLAEGRADLLVLAAVAQPGATTAPGAAGGLGDLTPADPDPHA